jgi:type II secretory pathway pseudopilin PulG
MQLKNKADSSPTSSLNHPTDACLANLILDSPRTQVDSHHRLPNQGKEVPLMPEFVTDTAQNKRRSLAKVGGFSILLLLGMGTVVNLPNIVSGGSNAAKARQAEVRNTLSAINRSQQSYYSEFKTFTNSLTDLGVGIKPESANYDYSIRTTKTAAFHYAIARQGQSEPPLKSYVGGVFWVPTTRVSPKAEKDELLTVAITCETLHPDNTTPNAPTLVKGIPTCSSGTQNLTVRP